MQRVNAKLPNQPEGLGCTEVNACPYVPPPHPHEEKTNTPHPAAAVSKSTGSALAGEGLCHSITLAKQSSSTRLLRPSVEDSMKVELLRDVLAILPAHLAHLAHFTLPFKSAIALVHVAPPGARLRSRSSHVGMSSRSGRTRDRFATHSGRVEPSPPPTAAALLVAAISPPLLLFPRPSVADGPVPPRRRRCWSWRALAVLSAASAVTAAGSRRRCRR